MDADISDIQVAAPSSSWRTQNSFLSTSLLSESGCKYCFRGKKITSNVFPLLTLFYLKEQDILLFDKKC